MPTLNDLFVLYMDLWARPHCETWRNLERCYNRYLSHWSDRPADSITKREVIELANRLQSTIGAPTANHVVELLRSVYNRAIHDFEEYAGKNPAERVRKFHVQPRERFFDKPEIERLAAAINTLRYRTTRDFFLLALFTAARRKDVMSMSWKDLDLDRAVWRIPKTKNKTSQYVPLVPEAVAILRERQKTANGSPWVFPSRRSRSGHLSKPEAGWKAVTERAALENGRIHDIRRTLASWQAITGTELPILQKTLNHRDVRSTMIYARLSLDPVRESMSRALREMRS